jgi:hypothetical protein
VPLIALTAVFLFDSSFFFVGSRRADRGGAHGWRQPDAFWDTLLPSKTLMAALFAIQFIWAAGTSTSGRCRATTSED